ncbi:hypothetical protein ACWCP6_33930 [Streptomyces sp. NPDC002004]
MTSDSTVDPEAATAPSAPAETAAEEAARPAAEPGTADPAAYEPAGPAPLGVERVPTGNAEVDAQLRRLADADHLATDGHLEVYEDVHGGLRDTLTALDARPGPPAPAGHPNPPMRPQGRP